MSQKRAYSFRCPDTMNKYMEQHMDARNIDRTSFLKLAAYTLSCVMARQEVKKMSLHQLVREVEKLGPAGFPKFTAFCDKEPPTQLSPRDLGNKAFGKQS